jgi:hypothetical protein
MKPVWKQGRKEWEHKDVCGWVSDSMGGWIYEFMDGWVIDDR